MKLYFQIILNKIVLYSIEFPTHEYFYRIWPLSLMIKGMFSKPENMKMYWKEFMHQCSEIGIGSLGIVVIISVFMGAVSAVQTAYQLVSPFIPLIHHCTNCT